MKKTLLMLTVALACSFGALPGRADTAPEVLGKYQAWRAYSFLEKDEKVCFMSMQPRKQEGKFKKRGPVSFFVTRWSGGNDKNTVSLTNGYPFRPGSYATVTVEHQTFNLFTQGNTAWTTDQTMDDALVLALQTGAAMVVKGTSAQGTETIDIYNLKGSSAALDAIAKGCAGKK